MRTTVAALVAALAALAAGTTAGSMPVLSFGGAASCAKASLQTHDAGVLPVGTDNPAYPPWFAGGAPKGSSWKLNDPATGKGFESGVAYAESSRLGLWHAAVKWGYVSFPRKIAPGTQTFDVAPNQDSYSPVRAKA